MKLRQIHIFYLLMAGVMVVTTAAYHLIAEDRVMFRKAEQYFHAGAYAQALAFYGKAFDRGFRSSRVYYRMADCFVAEGRFDDAANWYARLLEKHPDNRNIKIMMARTAFWSGDMETSIRYYREALGDARTD